MHLEEREVAMETAELQQLRRLAAGRSHDEGLQEHVAEYGRLAERRL